MNPRQVFTATLAVLAGLATGYVLLMSVKILIILLLAIIIASATRPLITRLMRLRVPSGLAILIIYGGILLSVLLLGAVILPPIINQFADYLENDWRLATRLIIVKNWLQTTLSDLTGQTVVLSDSESIRTATAAFVENLRTTAPDFLSNLGSVLGEVVLVIVMGIYWLASRENTIIFITRLMPLKHQQDTQEALLEIEESMGAYTRGIVFVALFVGIATFLILLVLQVPNAATYSFIIGVTTMLPVVGGFIGGGLATLLATLGSPLHGLAVLGAFIAVQQVEAHYLTPRTMSRSIGVDPLLVMVAVFVGFALYGIIGGIIAIPILGTLKVLLREFVIEPHQEVITPYAIEQGLPVFKADDTPDIQIAPKTP
jgi:predicted PurR-regulated permease PerM